MNEVTSVDCDSFGVQKAVQMCSNWEHTHGSSASATVCVSGVVVCAVVAALVG